MKNVSWYEREEDWMLKHSIIFNKNLLRITFIEVDRLVKLVGDFGKNSKVLDLCCGIGRHSIQLARHGFDVTGVDITKYYLTVAGEKAEKAGVNVKFVHSDMREYRVPGYYDLILNLCTSFGYFKDIEDDLRVLENIYDSLRSGGTFLIEILGKEVIARTFQEHQELEFDDCKVIAESRIIDDWTILECKRTVFKDDDKQEIIAYHRLYSAYELSSHLEKIGFRNIKVFGDFAGSPYNDKAKSMIMIAQK